MSKKILSTSIIQAVADNIRRLRNITSELQPKNFDEELKKVSSLDSHLMKKNTEVYSEAKSIPRYAFYEQANLQKIIFNNIVSLNEQAFYNCPNLKEVYLPDTYNGKVHFNCFYGCSSLEVLDLKKTSYIAYGSMENCTSLKAIILRKTDTVCILDTSTFIKNTPIEKGEGYIYVPNALLNSYKTATNWATHADKIISIEGSEFE